MARRPVNTASGVDEKLLAEATKLFAKQGFDRTSVQEIVEAAGVTKGAMYHYFGSKDDLLHEIYGRVLREQTDRLEKFAASEAPAAERVRGAAADVVITTIENLDDFKIFSQSMHHLSPAKQRAVRAERRKYHERFRSLIEEGQHSGDFRADVPADLVVDYFFGSVHHLGAWYRKGGKLAPSQIAGHYADLLLTSLKENS
ncbi:TetR/AcrR family transcriptional regulator [Kibdelosporangium philippinense]|uniref:TetR/AcrR family transcriptional regulator n=1 Tax=Kibdelosporangium philippinense TaxID=211113 RepID=A0ABS8ZMN1_9PSEU|nr:TetR/AcrR family transcriptional regulator [Kibdelosporangium philippinense]MCE7007871.1 TetR/AcrR family transcriptional regulator [Kibdelosporangium philippinense]